MNIKIISTFACPLDYIDCIAIQVDVKDLISRRMSQWKLMSTNVSIEVKVYECCPEPYASLRLSFTIQRSLSASSAVITPTVGISRHPLCFYYTKLLFFFFSLINFCTLVIAILTLATFFIPPAVGAKLVVGVLNVVVHCVFLLYLKTILPSGSINTPVIGKLLIQESRFTSIILTKVDFGWNSLLL